RLRLRQQQLQRSRRAGPARGAGDHRRLRLLPQPGYRGRLRLHLHHHPLHGQNHWGVRLLQPLPAGDGDGERHEGERLHTAWQSPFGTAPTDGAYSETVDITVDGITYENVSTGTQ